MKISPILIAAALAFGGNALAQSRDTAPKSSGERAAAARNADEPGVADKARRGAQRVGEATRSGAKRAASATGSAARRGADKVRSAGQAIERRLPPGPASTSAQAPRGPSGETGGTGAMGAGAAGAGSSVAAADDDRRQRMDDAYANWRRQQGQR